MNTNDPFLLRRSNAAELFLIRHADAIPEADEIIPSGVYDNLPLSRVGREQAQLLAERLKDIRFDAAYSSPLRRCQETAAPLLKYLGLELTLIEGLAEIRIGEIRPIPVVQEGDNLEILTKAIHERQLDIIRIVGLSGSWDSLTDSESAQEFRQRVIGAIDEIAGRHSGQRSLIFAHGGVINTYASEALGINRDFFFPCANTSITVMRASSDHRVVFTLNDVAHLKLIKD
jgi:broad specificity phosphatase PhoE